MTEESSQAVLYVSYDGLLEPLGQSQVLAYLIGLAAEGWRIHVISYEKPSDWRRRDELLWLRSITDEAGIVWYPLRYHRTPSLVATAFDVLRGILLGRRIARRFGIRLVHARSYVAAVIAQAICRRGTAFLFDMRGLWIDERIDAGFWPPQGKIVRLARWFERRFLERADTVVCLTKASAERIRRFAYLRDRQIDLRVIPTCVDTDQFSVVDQEQADAPRTLVHAGSVGEWYLFDNVVALFTALMVHHPGWRLLVLNRGEHDRIRRILTEAGCDMAQVQIRTAPREEMPRLLAPVSASAFFVRPCPSSVARLPTRLAELLSMGIPCAINAWLPEVADLVTRERIGVVVNEVTAESWATAAASLQALADDPETAARCRLAAKRYFSLADGVAAYSAIYRDLM